MTGDDVLLDALNRLRGTGPEFDGFLANHGPMAAEALVRIGAVEVVPRWVDAYRARLAPAPEPVRGIEDEDWREHLGDERLFGDWIAYLRREADEMPWRALLQQWWPRLLPGLAASATHGVIRTAHAVRALRLAGDGPDPMLVDELAQGLGFWAARYQPLPGHPALAGPLDAVHATAGLPRLDPAEPSDGPGVSGRLRAVVRVDGLESGFDAWGPASTVPDIALDELIGAAAGCSPPGPTPRSRSATPSPRLPQCASSFRNSRTTLPEPAWRRAGRSWAGSWLPSLPPEIRTRPLQRTRIPTRCSNGSTRWPSSTATSMSSS